MTRDGIMDSPSFPPPSTAASKGPELDLDALLGEGGFVYKQEEDMQQQQQQQQFSTIAVDEIPSILTNSLVVPAIKTEEAEGSEGGTVKEEEQEGEESGSFRSRCNTWPRRPQQSQQQQQQQEPQQQQQQGRQQNREQRLFQHQQKKHARHQHVSFGGALSFRKGVEEDLHQRPYSPCPPLLPLLSEEEGTSYMEATASGASASTASTATTTSASASSIAGDSLDGMEEEPPQQEDAAAAAGGAPPKRSTPYSPPAIPRSSSLSSGSAVTPKQGSRRNPWGNLSYADLIAQAIQSAPDQRLTLAQIYEWVIKNVPYFSAKGDSVSSIGWKNSIRHNLSLHSRFVRVQNEGAGKSSWWMLNPDAPAAPAGSTRAHPGSGAKHLSRRRANTLDTSARMEQRNRRNRNNSNSSNSNGGGLVSKRLSRSRDQLKRTASSSAVLSPAAAAAAAAAGGNGAGAAELGASAASPMAVGTAADASSATSSPDHFCGPFRARTSSNASSCGGRVSPFRTRTLSNASSCCNNGGGNGDLLNNSPPTTGNESSLSPWNGYQHTSPYSTVGYGGGSDGGGNGGGGGLQQPHISLGEALRKIKLEEQDQMQQQQQQQQQPEEESMLSHDDQASLRLLDLTLNAEASQKLMEALCESEEASGILQSLKQEQQQQQQLMQQQQEEEQQPAAGVPDPCKVDDTDFDKVLAETFGLSEDSNSASAAMRQQEQQQLQDPSQQKSSPSPLPRDANKIKILEQRSQITSSDILGDQDEEEAFLMQLQQQQQQQQLVRPFESTPGGGGGGRGVTLMQALTANSSLHGHLQRPRHHHHHHHHHHHGHHSSALLKGRPRHHHRHGGGHSAAAAAARHQLQQQHLQQQLTLQEFIPQQQQQQLESPNPSSFLSHIDIAGEEPGGGCGGGISQNGASNLTPVSESAIEETAAGNENGQIQGEVTNAYYEDFLRFTQDQEQLEQEQRLRVQQQQEEQLVKQASKDGDDDDSDVLLQTFVDPLTVGGFSSANFQQQPQEQQQQQQQQLSAPSPSAVSLGSF